MVDTKLRTLLAVPLAGLMLAGGMCASNAYAYDYQDLTDMALGGESVPFPGDEYLAELGNYWDQIESDYAPKVTELADGTKIQRTPSEYEVGAWQKFSDTISYNTYYLDGDNRGCNACHADLKDVVSGMDYHHPVVWNYALDNNLGVQQCLLCHGETMGYVKDDHQFGTLIHALHYGSRYGSSFSTVGGNCYSCHNATDDGAGMTLWDLVKYDLYFGMNSVAAEDVQGELVVDQDNVLSVDEMFSLDWMHTYYDNLRGAAGKNGANLPLDQELFDTWEITIDGTVNNPYTERGAFACLHQRAAQPVGQHGEDAHLPYLRQVLRHRPPRPRRAGVPGPRRGLRPTISRRAWQRIAPAPLCHARKQSDARKRDDSDILDSGASMVANAAL